MPYCQECGTEVGRQQAECHECGASLPNSTGGQGAADGGTSRRELLLYVGGAVAVLGGGRLAYDRLRGSSGPAGTAEAFVQALDSGNTQRANDMLHSQSSQDEIPSSTAGVLAQYDISIESSEVLERTDNQATVEVTLSLAGPMGETNETDTFEFELRTEDGDWKIYDPNL